MNRVSIKKINELCDILNLKVIKMQWLGDRKNYYYEYSIYNNGELIIKSESLKNIYELLMNMLRNMA